jgi:hypothetical protein
MGQGYNFECKDCGFSTSASLGIGFLYPNVCDEILGKMKEGDLGEDAETLKPRKRCDHDQQDQQGKRSPKEAR